MPADGLADVLAARLERALDEPEAGLDLVAVARGVIAELRVGLEVQLADFLRRLPFVLRLDDHLGEAVGIEVRTHRLDELLVAEVPDIALRIGIGR